MASRSARFSDEVELEKPATSRAKISTLRIKGSFKNKVLSRVFSEDYESARVEKKKKIFDPRGPFILRWNKILLAACLVSLFVDPLFFYLHGTRRDVYCIKISPPLEIALTVVRSLADAFYAAQIFLRFRTAFVAPSSRVFGRGELVIDSSKIAARYLSRGFWLDFIAALPLTQFLIWIVIPNLDGSITTNTKNVLRFTIIFQYLPRMFLLFPLSSQIVKTSGVLTETNWAGAAFNLILYMLVSHIVGASWYLLSIERQEACWREACRRETPRCQYRYFDCNGIDDARDRWFRSSNLAKLCGPKSGGGFYEFGIYADAVDSNLTSAPFFQKYLYCFWWGLKNLSSLGQNFETSMFVGENVFAIIVAILGLVLFGLLIGNMQSYLQSTVVRLEEWRNRRTDTEQWMQHRQLPLELKQCVRRYDQYKWVATQGVDEEALLRGLPLDLRRDIKRHLCIDLIRRVPLFDQMDGRMLDAICERLRPALYTSDTCLIRELDQVTEMLFIIRGHLDSNTTNGGRTGFFNSCRIGPGDFCGEELLTWALDARSSAFPSSTRTVRAVTEVEAFALVAEDLRFVAAQFRRLHSKRIRDKFRFYSQHWRTWAACFIQAAWRRHRRKRISVGSSKAPGPAVGAAAFVGRLVSSMRQTSEHQAVDGGIGKLLRKPTEPDFSEDEEN